MMFQTNNVDKNDKASIYLVDDHPIVRHGIRLLINQEPDLVVCGEASTAAEAIQGIETQKPQLALVGLVVGDTSSLELIKDLRIRCPQVPVVVFSMHDELLWAERAIRIGARGYVSKTDGVRRLFEVCRQVMSGAVCVSDKLANRIIGRLAGPSTPELIEKLSDRELQVLQLIGMGLANKEIASRLHVSVNTVESHEEHIKSKLQLANAKELAYYAFEWLQFGQRSGNETGTNPVLPDA